MKFLTKAALFIGIGVFAVHLYIIGAISSYNNRMLEYQFTDEALEELENYISRLPCPLECSKFYISKAIGSDMRVKSYIYPFVVWTIYGEMFFFDKQRVFSLYLSFLFENKKEKYRMGDFSIISNENIGVVLTAVNDLI